MPATRDLASLRYLATDRPPFNRIRTGNHRAAVRLTHLATRAMTRSVVPDWISRTHQVTRLAKRDDRCARITHTPGATVVEDRNAFSGLLTKSDVRRAWDVGKDLSKLNVEYIHVAGSC